MHFCHFQGVFLMESFYGAILVALLCSSSNGQELGPPKMDEATDAQGPIQIDALEANGINESIKPEKTAENEWGNVLQCGPFDIHLNAEASLVYNDNIYLQQTHPVSDLIGTLSPHLAIGAGDYLQKEESWLAIDYSPSFIFFANHSGNDTVDQDGRLNFEWRPACWTFGLKQGYQRNSGPVIEAGARLSRSIYDTNIYIKYDLSPKTTFELDGDQSVNDYEQPAFSFNLWTTSGWMDYWVTPKIRLGFGATGAFLDIAQNPNQTYQQGLLRAEYDVTENAAIRGSAGGELREFQSRRKNRFNGVFSLGGTYQPCENTTLLLDAYRRDESSLIAIEENYTVTGFSAGICQLIADKYALTLTGGFDHSNYYTTTPGGSVDSSYNYVFVRSGIDWHMSDEFTLGLFYQFQENISSGTSAFTNNLTGFNLAYHF
jgi:hypothetical protein